MKEEIGFIAAKDFFEPLPEIKDGKKLLADGTYVDISVPTRNGKNGRVVLTQSEIEEIQINSIIEIEKQKINNLKMSISNLEKQQTPRRLREAALGNSEAIAFLQDIENQINIIREQLKGA